MNIKFQSAGWFVAVGLAGVLLGGGFQGSADKFGVVDLNKAVQDSEMGKKNKDTLDNMVAARKGIIEFMSTNEVMTVEQATKLKNLSLKMPPTDAEKKDLDKVKEDVIAASKNFDVLNQKANPTEDDRKLLQEYNNRVQNTRSLRSEWGGDFQSELNDKQTDMINEAIRRADVAVKEVSKRDGYTVVFTVPGASAYGANDVTEAVTKSLNSAK